MYVVLLFVFFLITLSIGSLLIGIKLIGTQDPELLPHEAITTIISNLGHPQFDGVCYGFTMNWALAVAEGKEEIFYQQTRLLRDHQYDLPVAVKRVHDKKQDNRPLTTDEQLIETLPDLCKRICIAQSPLEYKKNYGKLVWQSDVATILHTINDPNNDPKKLPVRQIFYKTHTFGSKSEATAYFDLLQTLGMSKKIAVVIATNDHAMGFKRAKHLWRFININDLFSQQATKPYFEFTSEQLVTELYRVCTTEPWIRRLTVNTDFIALKPYEHIFKSLGDVFPVFPLSSKITCSEQIAFFAMAALQGDLPTVKKCLKAGLSIFSEHQMNDDSPLIIAMYLGRREVVKTMILSTHYRINQKRKSDLSTLLHIACKYGGRGIVEDLLKIKGILIDPKDKMGMTPLMVACESNVITEDKKLFELLLRKGASLTVKDKAGNTALDHATKNNHTIAVAMIQAKLKESETSNQRRLRSHGKASSARIGFFTARNKITLSEQATSKVTPIFENVLSSPSRLLPH